MKYLLNTSFIIFESLVESEKNHLRDWENELINYTETEKECYFFYKDNGYLLTHCESYKERFDLND